VPPLKPGTGVNFKLGEGEVGELTVDAFLVEPRHPRTCRKLKVVETPPWPAVAGEGDGVAVQSGRGQADHIAVTR
jgi:hypothetical protein